MKRVNFYFLFFVFVGLSVADEYFLNEIENALESACKSLVEDYSVPLSNFGSDCVYLSGCNPFSKDWKCDSIYGMSVACNCNASQISKSNSIVMFPPNPSRDTLTVLGDMRCRASAIGQDLIQLGNNINLFSLYVGFTFGGHISWPARHWSTRSANGCSLNTECPLYDPRNRPWYEEAISTGVRNIVIMIDITGSIGYDHWEISKQAAISILNTLSINDNIRVIGFNYNLYIPDIFQNTNFVKVNSTVVAYLVDWINSLIIGVEPSNFQLAFNHTFSLFNNSDCSQNVIVIISDGQPSIGLTQNSLSDSIQSANLFNVIIFSLQVNTPSASFNLLRDIACRNKGIYIPLEESFDMMKQLEPFFKYFSTLKLNQQPNTNTMVISSVFTDFTGLGQVISLSYPCLNSDKTLLAVIGTSFPLWYLSLNNITLSVQPVNNQCLSLTNDQLAALRTGNSVCEVGSFFTEPLLYDLELIGLVIAIIIIVLVLISVISWCGRVVCVTPHEADILYKRNDAPIERPSEDIPIEEVPYVPQVPEVPDDEVIKLSEESKHSSSSSSSSASEQQ